MFRILAFLLLPVICLAQVNSKVEKPTGELLSNEISPNDMKRKASYNLEEIKVRWKKAALENCPGVPCVVTPPAPSFTCGTSTVSDVDGNAYNTKLIGTQCWTTTNLKVIRYNDLTAIPLDAAGGSTGFSSTWQNLTTGSYTIYGNESSTSANATNYGFLYNWYAAKGITTTGSTTYKNICPTGWHVPTDTEWTTLTDYLGGLSVAGGKMKSISSLWDSPNTDADNTSGFSALPGGYRDSDGSFYNIRDDAFFWSATEVDNFNAWYRTLNFSIGVVGRSDFNKTFGASVRCLRD